MAITFEEFTRVRIEIARRLMLEADWFVAQSKKDGKDIYTYREKI